MCRKAAVCPKTLNNVKRVRQSLLFFKRKELPQRPEFPRRLKAGQLIFKFSSDDTKAHNLRFTMVAASNQNDIAAFNLLCKPGADPLIRWPAHKGGMAVGYFSLPLPYGVIIAINIRRYHPKLSFFCDTVFLHIIGLFPIK